MGSCALLGLGGPVRAGDPEASLEYPVKAAFLVNFTKFAEWPADSPQAQSRVVLICVLGKDPFGEVLDKAVFGRSAGGRPLVVQRHQGAEAVRGCHVVFVASSESKQIGPILESLADRPVITVGERDGFARQGGVIGLVVEDNRARFEVNLPAAQRAGLLLSSKLLRIARVIEEPSARQN
jgi:hypothetical protein